MATVRMKYTAVIALTKRRNKKKNVFNIQATETVGTVRGHSLQWIRDGGCLCVEEVYIVVVIER